MQGNMGKMMKQVQQMQAKMAKFQAELEEKTMETTAGGGMIRVVVNGKKELLEVELQPEIVDPEDIETLQDLILAAVNEAMNSVEKMVNEEMAKITGGMKIPGLF